MNTFVDRGRGVSVEGKWTCQHEEQKVTEAKA